VIDALSPIATGGERKIHGWEASWEILWGDLVAISKWFVYPDTVDSPGQAGPNP
jgi:hypothetical protein